MSPQKKPNRKNTQKELTKEERSHFGNLLRRHTTDKDLLLGWLKIHYIPSSRKGENNFDLSLLMNNKNFDHVGHSDIRRHWTSLPDDNRIPQRFRGKFMSQQLETMTAYDHHDYLLGTYQNGGTSSLTTGDIIWRRTELGRYNSRLGRWPWQQLIGRCEASLSIVIF